MHEQLLAELLKQKESTLTAMRVRDAITDAKLMYEEDNRAHGLDTYRPFWDLISDEHVHVLTIVDHTSVDLYVFTGDFHRLIRRLHDFSPAETGAIRAMMRSDYELSKSDISIPRPIAEHWLSD